VENLIDVLVELKFDVELHYLTEQVNRNLSHDFHNLKFIIKDFINLPSHKWEDSSLGYSYKSISQICQLAPTSTASAFGSLGAIT